MIFSPLKTKTALARQFNVTTRTVDRWVMRGVPHVRVGSHLRFRAKDVRDWHRKEFGR